MTPLAIRDEDNALLAVKWIEKTNDPFFWKPGEICQAVLTATDPMMEWVGRGIKKR